MKAQEIIHVSETVFCNKLDKKIENEIESEIENEEIFNYESDNQQLDDAFKFEDSFSEETENEPESLYEGSDISKKDLTLILLLLKYKHKFSESAMDDILNLLRIFIPSPNVCPRTFKSLVKKLNIDKNLKDYEVCSDCNQITDYTKTKICDNCKTGELIHFSVFDIIPQINSILLNATYLKQIKASNSNVKSGERI